MAQRVVIPGFRKIESGGGGEVISKNVIVSTTPIDGGNRVTFSYTLEDGTVKTSTMDVMDGKDGKEPSITIGANDNWFVDGIDTGVKAKGEKGDTGSGFNTTRQYSSVSDMMADTNPANDSEIVVVVLGDVGNFYMRLSSYVDPEGVTNGYLPIGSAQDISTIKGDPGKDGKDGLTPHIDSATKHWFIGLTDTGIMAQGADGADGKDGIDGVDGRSITSITKDDDNNIVVTFSDATTQNIGKLSVDIQGDFLTSDGFGNLRYYDGKFQYFNKSTSAWVDIEVTTDNKVITFLTPSSMKKFIAKYNMRLDRNILLIEEPDDTIVDGQTLCFVEKVIVRRKKDSAPMSETDGDLVTTILRKDFGAYSYNGYVDNDVDPNEGDKWYYRAFPISTLGIINNLEDNNITYTPAPVKLDPCTELNFSAQDSKVIITWKDPEPTKTVDGQTGTWASTILVYKEGLTAPNSLNDGIIAVEEKTLNQYSTSGFELAVDNGKDYSFSLFAITTDGAISEKISGTVAMYATLSLTTDEESLFGRQITISNGEDTITGNFDSAGKASFKIVWIGEISISCTDGSDTANSTVYITEYNTIINKTLSFLSIVTFADGTDEQIVAMIQAHYDDKINLSDYWAVGDTRTVHLSAMDAVGVGESHEEQDVQFVICDFEHDDLTTPVNGHLKAAVTLTQKNCLNEKGYINSTKTNSGGWEESERRIWCNDIFKNSIPSTIKSMIKNVNKQNYKVYNSTALSITSDYCFLLSETEIFGANKNSIGSNEGSQYEYYKTTSNRVKQVNGSNVSWWERSPYSGYNGNFCHVGETGEPNTNNSTYIIGLSLNLCL